MSESLHFHYAKTRSVKTHALSLPGAKESSLRLGYVSKILQRPTYRLKAPTPVDTVCVPGANGASSTVKATAGSGNTHA